MVLYHKRIKILLLTPTDKTRTHMLIYPAAAEHSAPTRKHPPLMNPRVEFPIWRTPELCACADPAGRIT